jgi:hypothetical protein
LVLQLHALVTADSHEIEANLALVPRG